MSTNIWYMIINPAAGNGQVMKKWKRAKVILKKNDISVHPVFTKHKGHAIELTIDGISKGYRKIMAMGGDGTNNEVINGILTQSEVPSNQITYTLLPVGTGNDWIKTHGIPTSLEEWCEMIKKGHSILQDIGTVAYYRDSQLQKRFFANIAGMSFDGYLVKYTEEQNNQSGGKFYYLFALFKSLFRYKIPEAKITVNDKTYVDYFYTINAGICKYSGGGMQLTPHAVPDDGLLAITFARKLSKLGVIRSTPLFYSGKIDKHPKVTLLSTKKIKVEAVTDSPVLIEVDGEYLGESPIAIDIIEKALKIIVPQVNS